MRSGAAGAANAVLNASGYVTARRRATVSSKVTGKVMEIFVEEGKAVRQVLARLDDSQLRAMLNVDEAQLNAARRATAENEARLRGRADARPRRQLVKDKVISRAELDSPRRGRVAEGADRDGAAAGRGRADAGRRAPDRSRRHGGARAVRRRRDLQGCPAGRDDLAGLRRRRLHPHRHLHHRRHVARDRGRRQRELHQPGHQPVEALLDVSRTGGFRRR